MQPGSSVATSLMPGEAVDKHVAILKITGKDFNVEPIRLQTVRPFVMKEIVLAEEKAIKGLWKKEENRTALNQHLNQIVEDMIKEGWDQYLDHHDGVMPGKGSQEEILARPLIRLRVEYTAPEGGQFDIDNPQRFSRRFIGKTANVTDVIQFYRKKTTARKQKVDAMMPDESVIAQITNETIQVDKLVKEFLAAQSLTILPQNTFGDAVSQFVDKDDKYAMEFFVNESLSNQVKNLMSSGSAENDNEIAEHMDMYRAKLEELFASGVIKTKPAKLKPKPDDWDSDLAGHWEDQAGALIRSEDEDEIEDSNLGSIAPKPANGRGGTKRAAASKAAAKSTRKTAASKATGSRSTAGKKRQVFEEEDEDESDILLLDDDDEEALFVKDTKAGSKKAATRKTKTPARAASKRTTVTKPATRQSTLSFNRTTGTATAANGAKKKTIDISDDDISDDDAFEPVSAARTKSRR